MITAKRFQFAMWDGGGNVPPGMGLARRLVERGHAVRLLADPTLAGEARRIGAQHTSWKAAPHRTRNDPEDVVFKDYEISNPVAMIRDYLDAFVGRPAAHWAGETIAAVESFGADVLVVDLYLFAALIAGEKLGIPTAAYCPNIWMLPTPGIPPFGLGLQPARTALGRARDVLLRAISRRAFERATPYLNAVRHRYGLSALGGFHEQVLGANEIYVLTSPRFDFTSPAMPPNVRYGGPILDDPSWCEPWQSPWSAGDARPLVLVGFSSTYQRQAAVLRRVVEALSTLPVRGLVTHCGHGTTMRGLVAGVPLVCVPMGRDQGDTAVRVVHHGAGVQLSRDASATTVRNAVARVLADPSYQRRARRLGDDIAPREGCVDVVESLERLASRRARPGTAMAP